MDFLYKSLAAVLKGPIRYRSKRSFPNTNETISSPELSSDVTVTRDAHGIPHIHGQSLEDVVFVQGYVHAQDRLWQMELNRRAARGQLSEIIGKDALNTDRTARTFGFERLGLQDYEQTSEFSKKLFISYINGVNFFLAHNTKSLPVEFMLIRHKPRKWELADVLALSRLVMWQLSHAWYSKLIRADIISKAGQDLAQELEINSAYDQGIILPSGIDFNILDASNILKKVKGPFLDRNMGSNSIAVSGRFTESGKPLLANDAHLAVTTPSIWYLNHLLHKDNFSTGASIPGIPMVLLGANRYFAWTATLSFTDCADLFIERINKESKTYEYKGQQLPCTVIRDEIKIKDKKKSSHTVEILITRNGVVISDILSTEELVVSVRDTALQTSPAIDGFFKLNIGTNWNDFVSAVKNISIPQLNVSYADQEGNIGYWCTGTVPLRSNGKSFYVPVPGWTGEFDWTGFVPFEEMPHALNPEQGFIVTANNKVIPDTFPQFLGNVWMNGYRSSVITKFISEAIQAGTKISPAMISKIMYNTYCIPAHELLKHISEVQTTDSDIIKVQMVLTTWDRTMSKTSVGATLYEVIRYHLVKNILVPTLGNSAVESFMGLGFDPVLLPSHEFYGHDTTVLLRLLDNSDSNWIRNAGGKEKLLVTSIKQAVAWLTKELGPIRDEWHWGRIHKALFPHAFDIKKPLNYIFNPKAIPMDGNTDTPKQSAMLPNNPYHNRAWSVSIRHLFDFSCYPEYFREIISPGQSGILGHKHYDDFITDWEKGTYRIVYLQPEKFKLLAEGKMSFRAKKE